MSENYIENYIEFMHYVYIYVIFFSNDLFYQNVPSVFKMDKMLDYSLCYSVAYFHIHVVSILYPYSLDPDDSLHFFRMIPSSKLLFCCLLSSVLQQVVVWSVFE